MHTLRRVRSTYSHSSGIRHKTGHESFVITSENYLGIALRQEMGIPVLCYILYWAETTHDKWQKYDKPTCWGNCLSGQIVSITCDRYPP